MSTEPQRGPLPLNALRIAAVRWEPYVLPLARPFATSRGVLNERRGFVLRVQDESGAWGTGEAAPLPAQGGEDLATCEEALSTWSTSLVGRDASFKGSPLDAPPAFGFVASSGFAPCALHALEQALLHLFARRAGVPLARWLHPQAPAAVPVNATLSATEPSAAAAAARHAVGHGFTTLKLKVGVGGMAADDARLRAVREAAGPDARMRLDANGAWEPEHALALLQRWEPLKLEYVEQPLPPDDLQGWVWLSQHSPVPLAADELIRTVSDADVVLQNNAAAVLVLKPMLLGGPLTALRVARKALERGTRVVITTVLEGLYGRLAALHTAAVVHALHAELKLPGPPPACGLATGALLARDLVARAPGPKDGAWPLPTGAGLGAV